MPVISYKKFAGEIPNVEPHLLPEDRAQFARNCDFSSGSLKPMNGLLGIGTMSSNPVKGIYTDDGINFFTWSSDTTAFKGPVVDDTFNRIYFLTPSVGNFNVALRSSMTPFGYSPSNGTFWAAGVPRPTAAPVLQVINRSTLPGRNNVTVTVDAWYEYAGKVYQKITTTPGTYADLTEYRFTMPAKAPEAEDGSGTPDGAVLATTFKMLEGSTEIFSVTSKIGSAGRSAALPGGLEVALDMVSTTQARLRITWGTVETRAYTYTWRNGFKEEGAPAPASTISVTYIQDVQVTTQAPPSSNLLPVLETLVYRTYGSGTTYLQTDVIGSGQQYTDLTRSTGVVGKALESLNWTPPPAGLQGLTLMPNGWFAAFKGNTLYMSEPYRPHAWPYSMSFTKNIRGIAASQQSMVVTTADGVHVVTGAFPGSAQSIKVALPQAGVAQRSMAQVEGAIAYASNDGIAFVSGTEGSMAVSQKLFTRSKWREMYSPALTVADLTFGYHDGCLVATSKSMNEGFTLRFDEDVGSFSRVAGGYDSLFYLATNDALYCSVGNSLFKFNGGAPTTLEWKGKDWLFGRPATFGAGYIRASAPVNVTLYADDVSVFNKLVVPGYFRMPSLPWATRWSIRLNTSAEVSEFSIAQTMGELNRV